MSNTIIELKHSQVSGNTPSSLANGEISINTYDGIFYYKNPAGTITPFAKYPGPAGLDGEIQFNDSGVLGSTANLSINKTTGTLAARGVDVANSIVVGNRVGFANTNNVTVVYQYYNAATNSLDTVFE
jgi:hypothetical protein